MNLPLSAYSTIVFDCDGVILDSNKIKTNAFYSTVFPWGEDAANELVAYHISNGGISRYQKFSHYINYILPKYNSPSLSGLRTPRLTDLLAYYASSVRKSLLTCGVAKGLESLRLHANNSNWCIVSGGDQLELRATFKKRGLDIFFDGGIFGSPDSKKAILSREIGSGVISKPALFIGDSVYDYRVAHEADIDFIFAYGWTDLPDWESFVSINRLKSTDYISSLLKLDLYSS